MHFNVAKNLQSSETSASSVVPNPAYAQAARTCSIKLPAILVDNSSAGLTGPNVLWGGVQVRRETTGKHSRSRSRGRTAAQIRDVFPSPDWENKVTSAEDKISDVKSSASVVRPKKSA